MQGNAGGRFALFLLGWGLIVYGLYATMCGLYVRVFPTKPRSSNPVAPLQHARHLWNARREKKLQQRAEMMRQTLGLEVSPSVFRGSHAPPPPPPPPHPPSRHVLHDSIRVHHVYTPTRRPACTIAF